MKIGIIGLGLIGGSLAIDFRSQGLEIFGVSRQQSTCNLALAQGIVNHASQDLQILRNAEIIFICTPLGLIIPTLEQLLPHLAPHTIVTDVGSVKSPIVKACSQLWPLFVGGHPMAGKAESGLSAACAHLFRNAPYVLTPESDTNPQAYSTLEQLVKTLGARFYSCSPQAHDQAVAWISHLPVMISTSLIQACQHESNLDILTLAQQLASSGFLDTSRVGGGNPELGLMMATYNRVALLHSLAGYRQSLEEVIGYIEKEDWPSLAKLLEQSQADRPNFLEPSP